MSTVAKYTFNSWLRKGVANKISETDHLGTGSSAAKERPTVPVDVQVNGHNVHKDFSLLSAADIIGINPNMVLRTEPLNWITNFEPNYLSFIEFYDEDFAWRYTPAKANGNRLRPWIALLILKEEEFKRDTQSYPLPSITVKAAASLPPHGELWAWAHAHVNESYQSQTAFEQFLQSLHQLDNPNADKVICRVMSPRKLEADTAYNAFLVPTFETGRQAGLGIDPKDTPAQKPAWDGTAGNVQLPIYYEWYFRTGKNEDFEFLVKELEPRVMDERVGRRDMDGRKPGFGMVNGTDLGAIIPASEIQEVIGLEGALKAPTTQSKPRAIDTSKPFFPELQKIVNLLAVLTESSTTPIDPVVSPPIYGENHAMEHKLDVIKKGWLHHLNKDPRNRVPAGFGTNVIQKNQESYVARAWQQVQKILEANKKIFYTAFAMQFSQTITDNFTSKLNAYKTARLFSPLMKKIKGSPTTLQYQLEESNVPPVALSGAFRKILRARGPFYKKLKAADPSFNQDKLLQDLSEGKISAAPPKQVPSQLPTVENLSGGMPAANLPSWIKFLIKHRLWILLILLLILLVIAIITSAWIICGVLAVAATAGYIYAGSWSKKMESAEAYTHPENMVEMLERTPARPEFKLIETEASIPSFTGAGTVSEETSQTTTGADAITFHTVSYHTKTADGTDSFEAAQFRKAATAFHKRLSIMPEKKTRTAFDFNNASQKIKAAVDPKKAYPKQLASLVYFSFNPAWLLDHEHLVPAMAYPDFEDPMYEKLRDISSELLLPNLNLIPPNTISLLVTNPEFIESYMVGLNHEFGKELLWREYPTDKRGSYFRQFWDVKGIITNETNLSQEALTEKYKDIKPLDKWTASSLLGEHNNRNIHGKKQIVLVIRGELFKKYPNTIVYAQKAHIRKDKNGVAQPDGEPVIMEIKTEQEMADELKFPVFKASIDPDIKFFGFDLTIEQAFGAEDPNKETDDWGYYFVIQQIPGEPKFGMDIQYDPDNDPLTPITWDDIAWTKFDATKGFIETATKPIDFNPGGADSINQWGTDAASMAYILYQKPVMIAVHAKEMLDKLK